MAALRISLPLLLLLIWTLGCAHKPVIRDRRVLVMDFQDTTAVAAGAAQSDRSRSLADTLTAELVNYPRVGVIERQDLKGLVGGRNPRDTPWQELGRRAGADYVIIGSFDMLNANHIINARILSVETGQLVNGSSVTRSCRREEDLYPLMQAIARVLAGHVKVLAERYDALELGQPPQTDTPAAEAVAAQ